MRCPFRFKRRENWSFGVDPEFMDFIEAQEDKAEAIYEANYPTCWKKFLHWLRT